MCALQRVVLINPCIRYGWSGATRRSWVHYNQQYNILELEKKAQLPREIWSVQFRKKWLRGIKRTMAENTLWTPSQCCLALLAIYYNSKGPIFISYYTLWDTSAFASALGTTFSCERFSIVGTNIKDSVNFCTCFLLLCLHAIRITKCYQQY